MGLPAFECGHFVGFCLFSAAAPLVHELDELLGGGHESVALPSRRDGAHAVRQHGGGRRGQLLEPERVRAAPAPRQPAAARRRRGWRQAPVPRSRDGAAPQALGGPHQDVQAHQRGLLHEEEAEGAADAGRGGGGLHALAEEGEEALQRRESLESALLPRIICWL